MAVGIFTRADDLHGHLVADHIRSGGKRCHLVATDRLAHGRSLSWSSEGQMNLVRDIEGQEVDPSDLETVWWRRVKGPIDVQDGADEAARSLIPAECRAALAGVMFSRFRGRWVNDPAAEVRADNKLVQLQVARAAGFAIPDTLVSSNPEHIRKFVHSHGDRAIVKVVRGTGAFSIPTRLVRLGELTDDESMEACPAIYQDVVEGSVHVRIHVFGSTVVAVRIESQLLDWRPNLDVPMRQLTLEPSLAAGLIDLVRDLHLAMGIIDAKLLDDGTLVFLEINPQGQFLFVEGVAKLPLAAAMAAFLSSQ